jgi:hypothetical protein
MNILQKSVLSAAIILASGYCQATEFNHGNHDDPYGLFGTDSIDTLNCGSLSLASCISAVSLTNITQQWCRNKVVDDTDGALPWGQGYMHTVQSYALHIISATDNGSISNNYSVELQYSCSGYGHPGTLHSRS